MLLFNATAVYVFLRYQFRDSLVSLFGAAVLGLAPIFAFSSTTPDLILVGTMPLAIYCLQRAIFEHRRRYAALAGIAIGATAFIGLYIYVCLSLTLIIYGARLTLPRWKCKSYWRLMLVLVFFAAALSSLRFYPMLVDRENLCARD